jgi:hypothetical protein
MPPSNEEFLDFLFGTIARRPAALSLRSGASVARYLDRLAYEAEPGSDRQFLLSLSKVIWGRVFQFAPFKMAKKQEVVQFLETFAPTHLAGYRVATALDLVKSDLSPKPYRPPTVLRTPYMSITMGNQSKRKITDDLSERIYAAYWALRLAKISGASHVAEALNRQGVRTKSRTGDHTWSGYEVAERIKQYENRLLARRSDIEASRRWIVDKWEAAYMRYRGKDPTN